MNLGALARYSVAGFLAALSVSCTSTFELADTRETQEETVLRNDVLATPKWLQGEWSNSTEGFSVFLAVTDSAITLRRSEGDQETEVTYGEGAAATTRVEVRESRDSIYYMEVFEDGDPHSVTFLAQRTDEIALEHELWGNLSLFRIDS